MTLLQDALTDAPTTPPDPYATDGETYELYLCDSQPYWSLLDPKKVKGVYLDPPYGMKQRTARGLAGRGGRMGPRKKDGSRALVEAQDFPPIAGDDRPFDPSPFLSYPRSVAVVLWGANWYSNRLPPRGGWIVWDKRADMPSSRIWGFADNADVELAWTNLNMSAKIISHQWLGMLRKSERGKKLPHPTRKPVEVWEVIIRATTSPGDLLVDFFAGSCSMAEAARKLGRRSISFELPEGERYLEHAAEVLRQPVLPIDHGELDSPVQLIMPF